MGKDSGIEWTDHTFNPWIGCTKVSEGCKNCYAETYGRRFGVEWGMGGIRRRTSAPNWRKPLQWNAEAKRSGVRRRVFCASLADVFEDRAELDDLRADLWRLIEQCPDLDWLVLTKRPENIMSKIPSRWTGGIPDQVWIGTTVENQKAADKRIPELFLLPVYRLFLSCEPLLGPVDLNDWLNRIDKHRSSHLRRSVWAACQADAARLGQGPAG